MGYKDTSCFCCYIITLTSRLIPTPFKGISFWKPSKWRILVKLLETSPVEHSIILFIGILGFLQSSYKWGLYHPLKQPTKVLNTAQLSCFTGLPSYSNWSKQDFGINPGRGTRLFLWLKKGIKCPKCPKLPQKQKKNPKVFKNLSKTFKNNALPAAP